VGGLFFAYLALRPAASRLEPRVRCAPWAATLRRFFPWVWAAIALIHGSGFHLLATIAGAGRVPLSVHLMLYVGVLMTLIFAYGLFSPYPALRRAVTAENWEAAAAALEPIRIVIAVDLAPGIFSVLVATIGAG
jgi:uncharacterized membrane protein